MKEYSHQDKKRIVKAVLNQDNLKYPEQLDKNLSQEYHILSLMIKAGVYLKRIDGSIFKPYYRSDANIDHFKNNMNQYVFSGENFSELLNEIYSGNKFAFEAAERFSKIFIEKQKAGTLHMPDSIKTFITEMKLSNFKMKTKKTAINKTRRNLKIYEALYLLTSEEGGIKHRPISRDSNFNVNSACDIVADVANELGYCISHDAVRKIYDSFPK